MRILVQQLVEYAWVFYVVCAPGALIFSIRAFRAQRQRSLALFTLERERAASQMVQALAMALVFVIIAAAVFFSTTFILPELPIYSTGNLPSTLSAGYRDASDHTYPQPMPTLRPTLTPTSPPAAAPTLSPPPTPAPTGRWAAVDRSTRWHSCGRDTASRHLGER